MRWLRRALRRNGVVVSAVAASLLSGLLIAADIGFQTETRPEKASSPKAGPRGSDPFTVASTAPAPTPPRARDPAPAIPPSSPAATVYRLSPPHEVGDGLTIVNGAARYRLTGLEGPAAEQICLDRGRLLWACGLAARAGLSALITQQVLVCRGVGSPPPTTNQGIPVTCTTADGIDLGKALVTAGLARPTDGVSTMELAGARSAGRGLWNGDWTFRPTR